MSDETEINGEMVEAGARALFDMESRDDKLVHCGAEPVLWGDVPEGCPAQVWARDRAAVVLAAALPSSRPSQEA
jgi:hypothetical protein